MTTLKILKSKYMGLQPTSLRDLYVAHYAVSKDMRGSFNRIFASEELENIGFSGSVAHINVSMSERVATLRGIHFQYPPHSEMKIVSCVSGSVWDVAVDLRPCSPTRFQWYGRELKAFSGVSMVIPEGFGHAFVTLEPNSTVVYAVSRAYAPASESGVRFDDPMLAIKWPVAPVVMSDKDCAWGCIEERHNELDNLSNYCR